MSVRSASDGTRHPVAGAPGCCAWSLAMPLEVILQPPKLAPRPADSNKGTFGRILVVAGSRGMSGAAVLCASAALRGGAGLVRLAVPHEIQPLVAVANPCFLTAGLGQDAGGQFAHSPQAQVLSLAPTNDVLAPGPGPGRRPATTAPGLAPPPQTPPPPGPHPHRPNLL